jgi:2-iminobutanoate/2-iminopropanoate deaminase
MSAIQYINPPSAPRVFGSYSHLSVVPAGGRTVYIAGQVAMDDEGAAIGPGDIAAQVPVIYQNIGGMLRDLGGDFSCICSLTTFVVGEGNLVAFQSARDAVYRRIFPGGVYPPHALLVIAGLYREGLVVEVQGVARLPT